MTKTLADLKRDLHTGRALTVTAYRFNDHKHLNVRRFVVKVQGNAVELNADPTAKHGSRLDFPKATLCDYDGEKLVIYDPGRRPLTPEEKRVMDNAPSHRPENRKQVEIDALTDGSQMFWRDKAHFKQAGMEHLFGCGTVRGQRLIHDGQNDPTIEDDRIKGEMLLTYTVHSN